MKKITFLLICLMAMFFGNAQYTSMAIVGDGAGGWPSDPQIDANQMTSGDGIHWTFTNLITSVGSVKFRAENSWTNNWGGTTFPNGTAIFDGASIGTGPGVYNVTFNSTTLEYTFTSLNLYPYVSLTGPGVVGSDWGIDTDLQTTDGIHYSLNNVALNGELKFRKDHTWTPNNWGGPFPAGTGVIDGPGIYVTPAGDYNVKFNLQTFEYSFGFPTIAFVGDATSAGWPTGAPGEIDPNVMTTTDGVIYTINSITLNTNGGKFRQDNAWAKNWGTNAWPSGNATQDGANIPCVAGTYGVTFNRSTGAYSFGAPLSTGQIDNNNEFKVYPNPASNVWNFNSGNEKIESIIIVDVTGKTVISENPQNTVSTIHAEMLRSGVYFAKVATKSAVTTIKLLKK